MTTDLQPSDLLDQALQRALAPLVLQIQELRQQLLEIRSIPRYPLLPQVHAAADPKDPINTIKDGENDGGRNSGGGKNSFGVENDERRSGSWTSDERGLAPSSMEPIHEEMDVEVDPLQTWQNGNSLSSLHQVVKEEDITEKIGEEAKRTNMNTTTTNNNSSSNSSSPTPFATATAAAATTTTAAAAAAAATTTGFTSFGDEEGPWSSQRSSIWSPSPLAPHAPRVTTVVEVAKARQSFLRQLHGSERRMLSLNTNFGRRFALLDLVDTKKKKDVGKNLKGKYSEAGDAPKAASGAAPGVAPQQGGEEENKNNDLRRVRPKFKTKKKGGSEVAPSWFTSKLGQTSADGIPHELLLSLRNMDQVIVNRWAIYHKGRFKHLWDAFVVVLVLWEVIYTPYTFAFLRKTPFSLDVVSFVIDTFFVLDLCLHCFTSYSDEGGRLISEHRAMLWNYVTSRWFPVDLISCFPFDLFLNGDLSGKVSRPVKSLRLLRLGKIIQRMHSYTTAR